MAWSQRLYKAVVNSGTAWLYGASAVNCSLLGIGERTGNTPLEAMVIEYAQLRGTTKNMRLEVITEIADYFEKNLTMRFRHEHRLLVVHLTQQGQEFTQMVF